ncbi:rolling circle replication-associated protein [Stenotrophomonas hibiscicola]
MNSALLEYFDERDFNGVAATLTFRAARPPAALTLEAGEAAVRELIKRLNKFAAGRRRRPLRVIAVREGGVGSNAAVRLHYHLKIEVPEGMTAENFASKVEQYWTKLGWASPKQNVVKPVSDAGWTRYITKRRSKQSYADGFDWSNTHLLPPPIAECSDGA